MDNYNKWEELATGNSGDIELERAWLRAAKNIYDIFCVKQTSYGPNNIAKFGEAGVVIRSNDKLERLKNLIVNKISNPLEDESIEDTWMDWADYGIIGLLCHRGEWPEEFNSEATIIATKAYSKLIENSEFLSALEEAGVDNWSGYSFARDILEEYKCN